MSSKKLKMSFMKVDRSYTTPSEWRLATFQEAKDNLDSIKEQDLLKEWDRARLLDGWISHSYFDYTIENTFNGCLDYMLVIQVHTQRNDSTSDSGEELYESVNLTEEGKQVALLLCACDWNYEVVYWLLNSWDKTQTMDPRDMRGGKIPVSNDSIVKETIRLNNLVNKVARKFGKAFDRDKTRNKKFTQSSIRSVLGDAGTSVLEKFRGDGKKLLRRTFENCIALYQNSDHLFKACRELCKKNNNQVKAPHYEWIRHADSEWKLIWDHFCAFHVLFSANKSLAIVINKLLEDESHQVTTSQTNFILSTSILYYIIQFFLKFHEKFITISTTGNLSVLDEILHMAAREGNVVITKKMLNCGAHVLSQDLQKRTALHVAFDCIEEQDKLEEMVKILLDKCDAKEQLVNSPDEDGKTVLHLACFRWSAEICKLLLHYGAKPDAKDNNGRLPLHYAAEGNINETIDVLKTLLDGCDAKEQLVNSPDDEGKTALHLASSYRNVKMCKSLLDYGAKPDAEDKSGQLPLHYAVTESIDDDIDEAIEVVKILLDSYYAKEHLVNLRYKDGTTVLHRASSQRNGKMCRLLLDYGAKPDAKDKTGQLPLHYAVTETFYLLSNQGMDKAIEVVKILLEKCDAKEQLVNSPDEDGKTVLHLASSKRSAEMCKLLLDYGAKPDAKDESGQLPLHYAVKSLSNENIEETIEMVKILLDRCDAKEVLVNSPDDKAKTVLHLASSKRSTEMCKLLLDYGAKPDAKDNRGLLPLHYAVEFSSIGNIEETIEMVKILLDRCDAKEQLVNLPYDEGKTVLHFASSKGNAEMCKLLLDYGAKPDAKDNRGRLPLHYAVEEEDDETIDVLIDASKEEATKMLTSTDSDGKSPSDIAIDQNNNELVTKLFVILEQPFESFFSEVDTSELLRRFASEGNTDIVRKMLERGANPLNVDWKGKTALYDAAKCKDHSRADEVIDLILNKCQDRGKLICMCDMKGKTAVHVAAYNGNFFYALKDSIDIKDRDGRSPLYYAIQGKKDDADIIREIIFWMESHNDLIDSKGLTLLHMAASQGKVFQVDALLRLLFDESEDRKKYVKRADYLGQTALHKAAKGGHEDTIKVLLYWGAQPLLERDCDGRTALHLTVQTETGEDGIALAKLLLKKCESRETKLLLLCVPAAGLGTADQNLSDCPLKRFLIGEKEKLTEEKDNLLRWAARVGDIGMTKELLNRGYQITDIQQNEWMVSLQDSEKVKVKKVLNEIMNEIKTIAEQGNDRPSLSDILGRDDFARGLAALLLNPYLKPPIAIGISGNWGMGKSSLMAQTEINLLKTAAQAALLPTSKSPSSKLPGVQEFELSKVGKKKLNEIKRWIIAITKTKSKESKVGRERYNEIKRWVGTVKSKESQGKQPEEDSLDRFLNNYEREYHKIFKSLAAIDSSDMFIPKAQQSHSRSGSSSSEGSVPAIITVQYNAWKYRNESEAMAGMAVEITKEMEEIMTEPQWLSTCWRNSWRKQKQTIWIEVFFPCLLAIFLAGTFTWIVWLLLDRYNVKGGVKLKYASLPATIVIMVWTLVKSLMSIVKPVSTQLINYVKFPDHTENLGYQERVISDIMFLKGEIRKKPYFVCTVASCIWLLITRCCMISYLCPRFFPQTMPNINPASTSTSHASDNPRIIVFVDDLDRCQESVILQVLSTINLVLAVCEISAIVGMDKALIQRAIRKKYGDESQKNNKLADKYLQKIIQLPLDLPDPSADEAERFWKRQLGVFSKRPKYEGGEAETDVDDDSNSEIDADYDALFSPFEHEIAIKGIGNRLNEMLSKGKSTPDASVSGEINEVTQIEGDSHPQTDARDGADIVVTSGNGANTESSGGPIVPQRKVKEICAKLGNFHMQNIVQNCAHVPQAVSHTVQALFMWRKKALLRTDPDNERSGEPSELQSEGKDTGGQSSSDSIPIREMLFVRYSEGEQEAFCYFQKMATDWRKMPRQWKCLLYYHRLIWYIFSMSNEARSLGAWQVQLIAWIFICWEWEENMNILIQNWDRIGSLKTYESGFGSDSSGPSLRAIVEHFIENDDKYQKMSDTGDDKHKAKVSEESQNNEIKAGKPKEESKEKDVSKNYTEKMKADRPKEDLEEKHVSKNSTEEIDAETSKEDLKGKGISKDTEDPESSKRGLEAIDREEVVTKPDSRRDAFKSTKERDTLELLEHSKYKDQPSENLEGSMKEKNFFNDVLDDDDESSNRVVEKLKQVVKEQMTAAERNNKVISEKLEITLRKEIEKALMELDEMKKEIRELKETKQQAEKNKKCDEEEQKRRKNWRKMKAALKRYDVSMEGIQAFQRFRFYCVAGYLPWPLPKEEIEDS